MKDAPKGYEPFFLLCEPGEKNPDRNFGSWKAPKHKITFPQAVNWMKCGWNIGIAGTDTDDLVIMDIDDPSMIPLSCVKPTLTIMSRKRAGYHCYYFGDVKENIPTEYGELRTNWQFVVAPGSYVETNPVTVPEGEQKDADMGIAHPGTIPNDGPEYAERLNAYMRGVEKWEHEHGGVKTWQRDGDKTTRRVPQSPSNQREFATRQEAKDYIVRASSSDHRKIMQDIHESSIDEALWAAHRQGTITIREPRKRSRKELKARQSSLESRIHQHRDHIKGRRTYDGRPMTEDEIRSWETNLANMEKEFLLNDHDLQMKEEV